jgi:probable phosphoglycerate mutase
MSGRKKMRLYIIRHADPDYPNGTITADGHLEAKALGKRLASYKLDKLYSSPMGRALHTMQYTADLLHKKATVLPWMQELEEWRCTEAPWEGMVAWDVPGEVIFDKEPGPTYSDWHTLPDYQKLKLEESFAQLVNESDAFLKEQGYQRQGFKYRCLKSSEEKIAVFCHNGFALTWLAHLLRIPLSVMWAGFWLPPSSVTTILFDQRSDEWALPRCIGLADTSHLYEAGLEIKPRGIKANYY